MLINPETYFSMEITMFLKNEFRNIDSNKSQTSSKDISD